MIELLPGHVDALAKLAKEHSLLRVSKCGPLLCVQVYVQSASASGYTSLYYDRKGEQVRV